MDTAVDIAKESADIILLEKSLLVLEEGVIEGRKVFGNIIKYIRMGASSNFGNMFSVLGASLFLPFLPMAPIQVLTNNLLYDFSQTAIPTDNVDEDYHRRAAPLGHRQHHHGSWSSSGRSARSSTTPPSPSCCSSSMPGHNPALFQTGWFVESLLTQTLIIHVIRTAKIPFLESRASAAAHRHHDRHLPSSASRCPSPGSAARSASRRCPGPTGRWSRACSLAYAVLTHLVKAWFVRRWGM